VTEYYKTHPSEERHSPMTDGDESDLSTTSSDERDGGSDTASVESPQTVTNNQTTTSNVSVKKEELSDSKGTVVSGATERLLPPVSQPPRKQKVEEYDSSATETADEENEASPGTRNSPKVLLYPNQTTITMVPSSLQNGPREPMNSELNVRDVVLNVIERSLKTSQQPPPPKPAITKPNIHDSRSDITFVREYRNDMGKPHHISSLASVSHPSRPTNQDGLATLSVVSSHGHMQQQVLSHPHSISSQIAATITPVSSQSSLSSGQNHVSQQPVHDLQKDSLVVYSQEPQTLDLSIKKPPRDNFPPPAHSKPIPGSNVTMYRNDPHAQASTSIVNPNPNYLSAMYEHGRPTKSPAVYMSTIPTSLSMSQQPSQSQHSIQSIRGHQNQAIHAQAMSQQSSASSSQSKSKSTPKLSPKITQHSSNSQQVGGPKGSITHGTPVNSNNQPILIQGPTTLSPRFDGILRQTPPSGDKLGSITQGTPVHLPPHHLSDKQRVYDYYKNSRQSPAQPSQQPSPQSATFGSPYQVRATGPYPIEQPTQLSSRQIIMNDFITSQQMHGQARGRSEKESPSPRSSSVAGSPASLYYVEKEQQRQRAEYLSRASPAEHVNNTPSPHRTPPPQRQGVIQRNTSGSKPPSPAPNRLHLMPQHHYLAPGHEAFSSLVDIAVQQPLLPVPHKDEKRAVPVSEHAPPTHHDIRYHIAAHEQMQAMQMHQRQAVEFHRQEMQRRQMLQERDQRERERERERERDQRERERAERQQALERERREDQFRHQRSWKSPERGDRERERIIIEEDHDRARQASKLLVNVGNNPFTRDGPNIPRERATGRPSDGNLTAASLIDAIITHQISQTATDPPSRDGHRPPFFPARDLHQDNNGKSHSPNVINIDLDSDRNRNPVLTKSITIGELTDSIITKDYSSSPFLPLRQPSYMQQFRPESTELWKMNRRLSQKDGIPSSQPQPAQQLPPPTSHSQSKAPSNSKMAIHEINSNTRSSSPRTAKSYHESITPPENYHYSSAHSRIPSQQSAGPQFALDCYVKNRIVEAMRTEDDKRSDDLSEQRRTPQSQPSSSGHHSKELDRSTPGEMVIDEEARPPSNATDRKEWTSFAPSTYTYPFSALNVSGAATTLSQPMKTAHVESDSSQRSIAQPQEPKPLLSAQYEALSDED